MCRTYTALILAFLTVFSAAQTKVTEAFHRYDTPDIRLDGTLIERKVYGPPGYGESPAKDAKETILVLKLMHVINVEPAVNAEANNSVNLDSAKNVHEVQLFIDRSQRAAARTLIGRTVTVVGTLNESITASQRTKVWVDVSVLQAK